MRDSGGRGHKPYCLQGPIRKQGGERQGVLTMGRGWVLLNASSKSPRCPVLGRHSRSWSGVNLQ